MNRTANIGTNVLLVYYLYSIDLSLFMDAGLIRINTEKLIKTLGKLFFVILFTSFSSLISASQIIGLYQSEVLVSSQETEERQKAFSLALNEVLVRVSGKASVLDNAELMQALTQPEKLVQKFSYKTFDANVSPNRVSGALQTRPDAKSDLSTPYVFSHTMSVVFSRLAINNFLKQYGEPVWGGNRPAVLLWVAVEEKGVRSVVSAASDTTFASALMRAAKIRGVPLYLPAMDSQDGALVNSSDIWGLFIDSLKEASSRYHADAVLAGRLGQSRTADGSYQWSGQWVFELKGVVYTGTVEGQSIDEAAMSLIAPIAEDLSERYAILGGEALLNSEIELEISDIKTMEDYVGVTRYIESLPPVSSAQLTWVKGEKIRFSVSLKGYLEQLEEHIELDSKLSAEITQSFDLSDRSRLYYRWSTLN